MEKKLQKGCVFCMNKQEVLEQYNTNYTEEEYFRNNVTYAFSQS